MSASHVAAPTPRPARSRRRDRGQSLVEFALLTPLLLLIISGVVEAGRAFTAYVQLANAAREGVRQASFIPKDTATVDTLTRRELPGWMQLKVVNVSVSCAAAGSGVFANCVSVYTPASGDKVKVQMAYAYDPIMPIVNDIVTIMPITMSAEAVMQVQ